MRKKSLAEKVSFILGIKEEEVKQWADIAPFTYKRYMKKKKNGGERIIYHPSRKTKALQYAIMKIFLDKIQIHDIAIAYRKGIRSPIKKELDQHIKYPYTIRVDMKDFFPSIMAQDLLCCLKDYSLSNDEKEFLVNCTFVQHKGRRFLGIGAPSSPQICNIVMFDIDAFCQQFAQAKHARVCRYADDIVFSSYDRQAGVDFIESLERLLTKTANPKLSIKNEKTRFMNKGNQRKVLGLVITPEQKLSIGRTKKRNIRVLIHQFEKDLLEEKDIASLKGYLHYIADVEPDFLHSLNMKYGAETIARIING